MIKKYIKRKLLPGKGRVIMEFGPLNLTAHGLGGMKDED